MKKVVFLIGFSFVFILSGCYTQVMWNSGANTRTTEDTYSEYEEIQDSSEYYTDTEYKPYNRRNFRYYHPSINIYFGSGYFYDPWYFSTWNYFDNWCWNPWWYFSCRPTYFYSWYYPYYYDNPFYYNYWYGGYYDDNNYKSRSTYSSKLRDNDGGRGRNLTNTEFINTLYASREYNLNKVLSSRYEKRNGESLTKRIKTDKPERSQTVRDNAVDRTGIWNGTTPGVSRSGSDNSATVNKTKVSRRKDVNENTIKNKPAERSKDVESSTGKSNDTRLPNPGTKSGEIKREKNPEAPRPNPGREQEKRNRDPETSNPPRIERAPQPAPTYTPPPPPPSRESAPSENRNNSSGERSRSR